MQWLELKVPPLLVWLVFAAAMLGLSHLVPQFALTLPAASVIAIALVAAGAGIACAGVIAFRRQRTTLNPLKPDASSSVVSSGIYRFSRNPMYLGILLMLAGWAVWLTSIAAIVLLPGFVAYMSRFQIEPEERALLAKFGPPYAHYKARVRRWI